MSPKPVRVTPTPQSVGSVSPCVVHYVSVMCHTEPVKRASVSPKSNALGLSPSGDPLTHCRVFGKTREQNFEALPVCHTDPAERGSMSPSASDNALRFVFISLQYPIKSQLTHETIYLSLLAYQNRILFHYFPNMISF